MEPIDFATNTNLSVCACFAVEKASERSTGLGLAVSAILLVAIETPMDVYPPCRKMFPISFSIW